MTARTKIASKSTGSTEPNDPVGYSVNECGTIKTDVYNLLFQGFELLFSEYVERDIFTNLGDVVARAELGTIGQSELCH